ncbi:alpha/beta hydrolase [Poritiphilus flavus]|uniref:Platelet-activating factor acetylhydrolase n=1 Tax=Poritiphilus flavus TaxID=2697053 RepID=A0A6L9EGB9_9FLAO|nr:hypothetical protein [Poritiphilus flavus]NAS13299.1 hypothetical protein [Poritiphilus flavus]
MIPKVFKYSILSIVLIFPSLGSYCQLPEPTGPFAVSKVKMLIQDPERPELYTEDPEDNRKVLLDVWYPTNSSAERIPYMHPEIQKVFLKDRKVADSVDSSLFYSATTHTSTAAKPDPRISKAPTLIFSHGASTPIEVYTTIFEDLASHGYIVFAIGHTYNTAALELPNGEIIKANRKYFDDRWTEDINRRWEAMMDFVKGEASAEVKLDTINTLFRSGFPASLDMEIWRKDISLALDKMEQLNKDRSSIFYRKLDLRKIGGFGHSYGGSAMGHALMKESRLQAAANLDGWQFGTRVPGKTFRKPFLYVRGGYPQPDALNSAVYSRGGKRFMQVKLAGTLHTNFGDLPLLTGPDNIFNTGTLEAERSTYVVNSLLRHFFDHTLKGMKSSWPLSTADFPELTYEH